MFANRRIDILYGTNGSLIYSVTLVCERDPLYKVTSSNLDLFFNLSKMYLDFHLWMLILQPFKAPSVKT